MMSTPITTRLATGADKYNILSFVYGVTTTQFNCRSNESRKSLLNNCYFERLKENQLYLAEQDGEIIGICDIARSTNSANEECLEPSLLCIKPCAMHLLARVRRDHGKTKKLVGRVQASVLNVGLHKLMTRYFDYILVNAAPNSHGMPTPTPVLWQRGESTSYLETEQGLMLLYGEAYLGLFSLYYPQVNFEVHKALAITVVLGLDAISKGEVTYAQLTKRLTEVSKAAQKLFAPSRFFPSNCKGYSA